MPHSEAGWRTLPPVSVPRAAGTQQAATAAALPPEEPPGTRSELHGLCGGHNMAFTTLGVIILWIGWFGFNPGSTLSVDFGGVGFFAYVALTTNIAAAAGVLGAVLTSWIVIKKPDLSMMLNGAVAALVAITAACAFVAPWAAIVIGLVSGAIVVVGVLFVEKVRID